MYLIADIGGTNARFALVDDGKMKNIKVLSCADYQSLAQAALAYLADSKEKPQAGAFAVATPIEGWDSVTMTNHTWSFSIEQTRKKIGLDHLRVINDFAALAYAMPYLAEEDRFQVGGGHVQKGLPLGIVGPGTGLGVSAVVFADGKPVPVTTEGGHVTMAATTQREFTLFEFLRQSKYSHVSAERVLSGKGLVNLYNAIRGVDGLSLPDLTPEEITVRALERKCPVCMEVLDLFCHFLGIVGGNLALSYGAFGGIYIAGGIVPQLGKYLTTSRFRESFEAKGRFRDYMSRIPSFVVTHPYPGLAGLQGFLKTL